MAKKNSKHYPVVRGSPISSGAAANTLVDTARNLSVLNRRLYRYGRYYNVKVDVREDYAGAPIEVFALRDDWAVQKGFQMAYQQYLDMTMEERENLGTQVARWEDFRCLDGLTLAKNDARPVLHTVSGGATVLNAGEFQNSLVVDSNDASKNFTWGAGSGSAYGILQEYDLTGNAQQAPDSQTGTQPYADSVEGNDAASHTALQNRGDQPPYDQTGVNATSPWVRIAILGSSATAQKLSSGFFTAPCGLILLKGFTESSDAYSVEVEAKSGDYKGVHAPSMIEVATVNRKRKVVK